MPKRTNGGPGKRPTDESGELAPGIDSMYDPRATSPEVAFTVLGNRIRLSILRALWNADTEPLSFAELERRTPVETDNFAYHLDQLVDHFVQRSDDGYRLRYAGEAVMRAIIGGLFTESSGFSWLEFDSRCPYCGAGVEMRYRDDQLTVRCTDCGGVVNGDDYPTGTFMSYGFPPAGLVDRSPEAVLEAAHVLYDAKLTPMMAGVCPECAATVDHAVRTCDDHDIGTDGICEACETRFSVWIEYTCDLCGYRRVSALWFKLFTEPAVIAFYHEHSDFDRSVPFSKLTWENAEYIRAISQTVVSTDPLRVRIDIPLESAELRVTVDEDLEIQSLTRDE